MRKIQNQLIPKLDNSLATITDIASFVLVGREKLISVRAEIRAIDKLQLAEEVREQKRGEAQMLSEALLDAEVRLGELMKEIPKADSGNQYTGKMVSSTAVTNQKPKHQVIAELGFNKIQAHRFETLADNKDLVEQVKAEARENDDLPTRTRVLDLAQARKQQFEKTNEQLDEDLKMYKIYSKAICGASTISTTNEFLDCIVRSLDEWVTLADEVEHIDSAIKNLNCIKNYLIVKGSKK